MRLHVVSDLHLELGDAEIPQVDADVLVLAGDVGAGGRGLDWALARSAVPVVYVLGNHEYYGQAMPRWRDKLQARARGSHVHLLEDAAVDLAGVTFLGCTLWTDLELHGDFHVAAIEANVRMNDYRRIRVSPQFRRLRPADTAAAHARSRRWLEEALAAASGPAVVITHHAPSRRSLDPTTAWQLVSAAYASNLDALVESSGARLWVHGHTHFAADYRIAETRVLSNPRGYPDEPAPGFDPELVVEV